ncbi:MAG: adenylyltransferase/cytidyltransferase family protein, partial [Methanomassiliicoccales archaeon]
KIVHCHGCFDLLHPGHIRHFEAAKKMGDILVVTVTPDKFVEKGPGRPVFNQDLRLESIAALNVVDYVALNKWETAIETIRILKPDIYVKGSDYADREKDVTGKIYLEEDTIKSVGGEIRFTDEITFSSTELINTNFDILSEKAKHFLNGFRKKYDAEQIIDIIKTLSNLKVLIIGDAIIDDYSYCRAMGKVEKSPIVSCKYLNTELFAGGSLAIANHITEFSDNVTLITCLGKMDDKEDFIKEKLNPKIRSRFFYRDDAPTIVKKRYIEWFNNTKMFEIYFFDDTPIQEQIENDIINYINGVIKDFDLVLVADFGHGLITQPIIDIIIEKGKFIGVNAQTNSGNFGYNLITKYKNVNYIQVDERELRLPFRDKFGDTKKLIQDLREITNCNRINVTLGTRGCHYFQDGLYYYIPVFSDRIVDTVGAGDAVLSITSMLACKGVKPNIIPFVSNCTGAWAVKILGNKEPVNPISLYKFIKSILR